MSSGAELRANQPVKMLITGDSGTAKTGGRVSLILDGYKLRDIDVDNKIDIILHCLHHPKSPYYAAAQKLNLAEAYRYETVNHKMITMEAGNRVRIQPSSATVWPRIEKLVHEWRETPTTPGSPGIFLGPITSWGPDTILSLDSLTFAGFAAFYSVQELNNQLGSDPSGNAWRRSIGVAQDYLDTILKLLASDAVKCHVIVTTHINYMSESWQKDSEDRNAPATKVVSTSASDIFGISRAYPTAIGRALGPRIGTYFNNVIEAKIEGNPGTSQRRRFYTIPTGAIAVKTSAPFALRDSYDISTGLAEIFYAIRGTRPSQQQPQKPVTTKETAAPPTA